MVKLTGTFTLEKTFEIPEVKSAFKKALKSQGINSNVKVQCVSHYDFFKDSKMGNISVYGRKKSAFINTKLNYRIPIAVAYNREKLGNNLNLTSKELKKIILCAINDKNYKPWKCIPKVSAGATRGHTKRGISMLTGLPYDRVSQVTEHSDIWKLGDNFVNELINKSGFDMVIAPYVLMKNYFTGNFDISSIDGKKPQENGYEMNDYLLYASHNGKQLETQEAISNALKDVQVRKELKKVGIIHSNSETRIERLRKARPELFVPHV